MSATPATDAPLLRMQGIDKSFPGVRALQDVSLTLQRGEVLALLGENGAGKSTLMKILGGALPMDSGSVEVDGHALRLANPHEASDAGIAIIYQEFNLVPGLNATENIFLGREISGASGLLARGEEEQRARELFQRLGMDVPLDVPCRSLTTAQQQLVEIAKALAFQAKILVMDEPTAALSPREVESLFRIIADLKQQGIGIIYISHRLDEVFEIADRAVFLRDGEYVTDQPVILLTRYRMIEHMVGRELRDEFPKRDTQPGEVRLEVANLNATPKVRDVSFNIRRGEILALTGLIGAGRTETARLIFGADPKESGSVSLDGRPLQIRSPRDAIAAGIGLLTEDRKLQGLILGQTVRSNYGLPNLDQFTTQAGFVNQQKERDQCESYIGSLKIKTRSTETATGTLSGGNQQKVVLAKWLARNCEVLIFDEPTRGIDVGAKYEIYLLMNRLVAEGKSILMISSELPEVLGMADRILVMHEGSIRGEIDSPQTATQEDILRLAVA